MKKIRTKFIDIINKNGSSGINLFILAFIALFVKQYCTYISYRNLNYGLNYYINSFFTDLIVIIVILGLVIINQHTKNSIIKIFNNIISFIIFIIFCTDIFTIHFLQSRISIFEGLQYIKNGGNGFTSKIIIILAIITFLRIALILITKNIKKYTKATKYTLLSIFFILLGLTLNFSKPREFSNIISINLPFLRDFLEKDNVYAQGNENENETEDKKIDETNKNYNDYIKLVNGEGKKLNVILVFAESLSAIDSANIGGNNNMPYFDKIQNNGITFTNFITNGKTSDTAHIATLYGTMPLINIGADSTPYSGYKLIMEPLPKYLNTQGYSTTFISTASLKFLDQIEFLNEAGFEKIIGEEEFTKNKKYTFDAAPDKDLYDKALQEIIDQTGNFFMGLQTISFHTPYNTPLGKTEETALQYSDEELYRFYKKLERIGFFKDGILIIVGDHRKTKPAENMESTIFGDNRYVRSVATIVGSGIEAGTINTNIIQHTDFYNSIKRKLGNRKVKIDETYNDVFSNKYNRKRGITSARYYTNKNKYTVSYLESTGFTFNNISTIDKENNKEVYNYLSSYMNFEFNETNENDMKFEDISTNQNETILIGHQGSHNETTENTLEAFVTAKKQGAKGIELDISYTKDKKNIVGHGKYINNSNCKNKEIKDYNYERIKENCIHENGEGQKTLDEMLELIDGLFDYYFIEIKVYDELLGEEQTLQAIKTVKDLNMQDRVIFISYSDAARKTLDDDQEIIYGRDTYNLNDLDEIGNNNSKYFLAPYDILTSQDINKAKNLGKEVATYTINDTGNFEKMVDLGVHIILTDNIELLKQYQK